MLYQFKSIAFFAVLVSRGLLLPGAEARTCDFSDLPYYIVANQNDADAIKDCSTVQGWVSINVTEGVKTLTLEGVKNITGTLNFGEGAKLDSFVATDLLEIGEALNVFYRGHQNMTFSALTTVGDLVIGDYGDIEYLNFPSGLSAWSSEPGEVLVLGTNIAVLENIHFSSMESLIIRNNSQLHNLTLDVESIGWNSVQQTVLISGNGNSSSSSKEAFDFSLDLPHLSTMTGDISIEDLTDFNTPELSVVNGSLSFQNVNISTLELPALTNLLAVAGYYDPGLKIEDSQIDSLRLPVLKNASALILANNKGSLYDSLWLPRLQNVIEVDIETGNGTYPDVNCSDWGELVCNGTSTKVFCLETEFYADVYNDEPVGCPVSRGDHRDIQIGNLAIGMLFSFVGANLVTGLL